MKKTFWMGLVFCLSVPPLTSAETYYVDSRLGQDAWSGKLSSPFPAGCSSACIDGPWRSLYKISISTFIPGDSILLNRARSWSEGLWIQSSGAPGRPLQFGAYGVGAAPPLINPPLSIGSWTPDTSSIWKAPTVSPPASMVWVGDTAQEWAREPNDGYFTIDSTGPLDTQFIDNDLILPAVEVIGSTIQLHNVSWSIETCWVVDYSTTTHRVTLNKKPTPYPLLPGGGYVLSGKRSYLDKKGEWAWEGGQLFLWPSDNLSPVGRSVGMSRFVYGVVIQDRHDVTIQDWAIRGADPISVVVKRSTGIVLSGLDIQGSGSFGVYALTAQDLRVENCNILNSGNRAIENDYSSDVQILHNTVENTGLNIQQVTGGGAIFSAKSDHVLIEGNIVQKSGYNGITAHGDHTLIKNNRVESSCMVLDDCGAIYTSGSSETADRLGEIQIVGNMVKGAAGPMSSGIYLDDKSNHVRVEDNTIQDVGQFGIYFHNTHDSVAVGNTVYGSSQPALMIIEDTIGPGEGFTRNNRIENNLFFPSTLSSSAAGFRTMFDWTNFGDYDRNVYGTIYSPHAVHQVTRSESSAFTLSDWTARSGQDQHSLETASFYKFEPVLSGGPDLMGNGAFTSNVTSWSKWTTTGGGAIAWNDAAACGHDGGCLAAFYASGPSDAMSVSTRLPVAAGTHYMAQLDLRSRKTGRLWLVLRQAGVSPDSRYAVDLTSGAWKTIAHLFSVTVSDPAAILWLETRGDTSDYQVDNISFRAVTPNDLTKAVELRVNAQATPQSFPLSVPYVDARNNTLAGAVVLPPFSSMVLIPAYNNHDGSCNNRETHFTAPGDCPTAGPPDVTPPTVALSSPTSHQTFTNNKTVTIAALASDNIYVSTVQFFLDGVLFDMDTTSPYTTDWPVAKIDNGTHTWTAKAFDAAGNHSTTAGVPVTVAVDVDATNPLAPSALSAEGKTRSLVLTWPPSTDSGGSGVAGYRVGVALDAGFAGFVDGWNDLNVGSTTTVTVSGLAPDTVYYVRVRAFDGAGNLSDYRTVSARTLPEASPTVDTARAYPVPYRPGLGATGVTFDRTPEGADIRLFTNDSRLVKTLAGNSSGVAIWDLTNDDGTPVASGVYLAMIEKNGARKKMKVVVQK